MKVLPAVALLAVTFAVVACGNDSGPDESASDAALRQLGYALDGQWSQYWSELHPAHQALASQDAFIECTLEAGPVGYQQVEIIEEVDETLTIYGLGETDTKAVLVEYSGPVLGEEQSVLSGFTEIVVDGEWRWASNEEALSAFEAGECPFVTPADRL